MGGLSFHISFLLPPSSIGSISLLSDHTRPVSFLSHSSVGPSVSFLSSLLMLVSFGSPVSFPSMRFFISFRIGILSWVADVRAFVQVKPASSRPVSFTIHLLEYRKGDSFSFRTIHVGLSGSFLSNFFFPFLPYRELLPDACILTFSQPYHYIHCCQCCHCCPHFLLLILLHSLPSY